VFYFSVHDLAKTRDCADGRAGVLLGAVVGESVPLSFFLSLAATVAGDINKHKTMQLQILFIPILAFANTILVVTRKPCSQFWFHRAYSFYFYPRIGVAMIPMYSGVLSNKEYS
jgi:hypothetical protein